MFVLITVFTLITVPFFTTASFLMVTLPMSVCNLSTPSTFGHVLFIFLTLAVPFLLREDFGALLLLFEFPLLSGVLLFYLLLAWALLFLLLSLLPLLLPSPLGFFGIPFIEEFNPPM